jgi:hypothetical protein
MIDFRRVNAIENIVTVFRERSPMQFRRFSMENYVQTHIAWGLCLIAIGNDAEGETHIRSYCDRFEIDRNDPILRKSEVVARASTETRI